MLPTLDLLEVFYACFAFAVACSIYCLGNMAAQKVWSRAKKEMDANPYSQEVVVPYATSVETLLIFFAIMLRSPFMLVRAIYRELQLEQWERSRGIRELDFYQRSCTDLLGSVSNMLSGYPERAKSFYVRQRGNARAIECARIIADQEGQNSLLKG